jgi:hypothetical protein
MGKSDELSPWLPGTPLSKKGYPKLYVSDAMADRWIAAGAADEDDLIRTKPIPNWTNDE